MSGSVNKVILIGNVGQDPEIRALQNGDTVANLSLATSETWKDKNTGERKERTEWHRLVVFRKLADIVSQYVHKGDKLYVEGQLQTRKWQDNSGQDRYTTEINVHNMTMLSPRSGGANGGGGAPSYGHSNAGQQRAAQPQQQESFDDDIPF